MNAKEVEALKKQGIREVRVFKGTPLLRASRAPRAKLRVMVVDVEGDDAAIRSVLGEVRNLITKK